MVAHKIRSIFLYSSRKLTASILIFALVNTFITIIQALLLSTILLDAFRSEGDLRQIQPMIYWLGLTFLLKALLAFFSEKNIGKESQIICAQQRSEVIEKISKNGMALAKRFGDLKTEDLAIHEVASVKLYLSQFLPRFVTDLVLLFSIALIITSQDLISGALIFITLILIAIFRILISRSRLSTTLKRSLSRISILEMMRLLLIALTFFQVAYRLNSGDISELNGLAILIFLLQIYHPMKALTITPHTFLSKVALDGKSAENSLTEIIKFENGNLGEITNIGKFKELRWTDAFIKSDRDVAVGFRWGISSAGKLTVVTGNDGAGKIALINSIIRMQDLEKGRIFIEGTKETYRVDQLDLDYWLRQVSWVSQNPNFIDGTVEENLKLIKPRANKEMLHDLLSQVNLTVEELSDGLATKIYGQQGGLSQSQLQRLAIARLILKDSPIAIFDDFSISLDLDNQKFFHIVLKELARKGKVVLAISDNEDLIKLADRVISLESSKEKVQI
jgi:ABC-type transport system involved in cytochrome bd biosynthesis fused ATPase/permease subunit